MTIKDIAPLAVGDRFVIEGKWAPGWDRRGGWLQVVSIEARGAVVDLYSADGVNKGHRHLIEWTDEWDNVVKR